MAIRMTTPESEIARAIEEEIRNVRNSLIYRLNAIGEKVMNHVKSIPSPSAASFPTYPKIPPHQPNYIDWSRNLRSSIGYAVVIDGAIANMGGYEGDGEEGRIAGKNLAEKLAASFPGKIALIVTAGMEYASYVADKGYDVLDTAEALAKELLDDLIRKLSSKK